MTPRCRQQAGLRSEPPGSDLSAALRQLAGRVRRTSFGGRWDPEAAMVERDEIAHGIFAVARSLDQQLPSTGMSQPRLQRPAKLHVVERRREALVASQRQEIARLEQQLAQAVRRPPRRRSRSSNEQLVLPLPEKPHGPDI